MSKDKTGFEERMSDPTFAVDYHKAHAEVLEFERDVLQLNLKETTSRLDEAISLLKTIEWRHDHPMYPALWCLFCEQKYPDGNGHLADCELGMFLGADATPPPKL